MGVIAAGSWTLAGRVAERAAELADARRVVPLGLGVAEVIGDHGDYRVVAGSGGVVCDCPARGACSHAAAAMLVWREGRR